MKKIFAFLLCAIFMLTLVGCDSDLVSIDDCTWELSSALNLNDKGEMTHGSKETVSAFGEGAEIICVIAGIAIVLFLPKIYIKKGEKA